MVWAILAGNLSNCRVFGFVVSGFLCPVSKSSISSIKQLFLEGWCFDALMIIHHSPIHKIPKLLMIGFVTLPCLAKYFKKQRFHHNFYLPESIDRSKMTMKNIASWNNWALETGLHRLWNSQTMKIKREWTLNTLLCAYCKEIMDHYRSRGSGRIWAKCSLVGTKSVHLRPFSDCTARDFGRRSPSFTLFLGHPIKPHQKIFLCLSSVSKS